MPGETPPAVSEDCLYLNIWTPARSVHEHLPVIAKSGNPNGPGLPPWPAFTNADHKVLYLGDPITVNGVANIDSLRVFDAVYTSVRGKPFAAR